MPAGFTASLATRLDGASAVGVREARTGDLLEPGAILVAPGGKHLRLSDDRRLRLADDAPEGGLKPRADFTIADAARLFGRRVLLVVLTGMGKDGLEGAAAVKAAGGRVLVEAESTCTVYGMPRAVAEAGLADAVLPLDQLADAIAKELAMSLQDTRHAGVPKFPPWSRHRRPRPRPARTTSRRSARPSARSAASTCSSTSAARWSAGSAPGRPAAAPRTWPSTRAACAPTPTSSTPSWTA